MHTPTKILYCRCVHADAASPEAHAAVRRGLASAEGRAATVSDLCGLAARRDPMLAGMASGGPLLIGACEERAVRWLFAAAGAPLPAEGVEVVNLRTAPVGDIAARIAAAAVSSVAVTLRRPDSARAANVSPTRSSTSGSTVARTRR